MKKFFEKYWRWDVTVLGIVIIVVVIIFLAQKPEKHLHLYGHSNWIQCRPDTAGYRESFGEKVTFATGMAGGGIGNFDIAMFLDSTGSDTFKNLALISPYSGGTIPLESHSQIK